MNIKNILVKLAVISLALMFLVVVVVALFLIIWGFGSGVGVVEMIPAIILYSMFFLVPVFGVYYCVKYLKKYKK